MQGIHIIMTYKCNLKCNHCFIYSDIDANGIMNFSLINKIIKEAQKVKTIDWIYFEGGEPFLYYPVLIESIKLAKKTGFKVGIVTNGYGAVSYSDALIWLAPLAKLQIDSLNISNDVFHYEEPNSPASFAFAAAQDLGIPASAISIEKPQKAGSCNNEKGKPIVGGKLMFRGRAAEKLTKDLPETNKEDLQTCPYEELVSPKRVHIDCYGHIHLCQGLTMGNMNTKPLSKLILEYNYNLHPICNYLQNGGPHLLAKQYNIDIKDKCVDECHYCYLIRSNLINKFPQYLTPKQVYGF